MVVDVRNESMTGIELLPIKNRESSVAVCVCDDSLSERPPY